MKLTKAEVYGRIKWRGIDAGIRSHIRQHLWLTVWSMVRGQVCQGVNIISFSCRRAIRDDIG